jgi:hypothetical protein
MNVKSNTPISEIMGMIQVQYAEVVGYKVCQITRLSL